MEKFASIKFGPNAAYRATMKDTISENKLDLLNNVGETGNISDGIEILLDGTANMSNRTVNIENETEPLTGTQIGVFTTGLLVYVGITFK